MITKKQFLTVVVMILGLAFAKAQRGARVAYIDMDRIIEASPEYKKAVELLGRKADGWKREMDAMQAEIDKMEDQLKNERVLLTKELIEEKEEDIQLKKEELATYQQKRFGSQGDYILQQKQLIQPVQDQVFNEVQKISEARKYDYVMNAEEANLLFAAERHDISDLVIKSLERAGKSGPEARQAKEDAKEEMEEPYLNVEEAEAREEKEKAKEEQQQRVLNAREEKLRRRDSLQAAKRASYEARKKEIQRRRDSIKAAREAARKEKEEERENN